MEVQMWVLRLQETQQSFKHLFKNKLTAQLWNFFCAWSKTELFLIFLLCHTLRVMAMDVQVWSVLHLQKTQQSLNIYSKTS